MPTRVIKTMGLLAIFTLSNTIFAQTDNTFQTAVTMLKNSNTKNTQSQDMIIKANTVRNNLNVLRAKIRNTQNESIKTERINTAEHLTTKLEQLQYHGAILREKSLNQRASALLLLEQSFYDKWKSWINNRAPLTMDVSVTKFIAHNTGVRSVHSSMLNKMGTAAENFGVKSNTMSIMAPALAAQSAPDDLNISAFQLSRDEKYFAHIEVHTPIEKTNTLSEKKIMHNVAAIPLNTMHKWRLLLSDLAGNPVRNMKIDIVGHMPGHVHGLPTQPVVSREIDDGVYQVEGIKFQMKGWWVIQFIINDTNHNAENITDTLQFNLVL